MPLFSATHGPVTPEEGSGPQDPPRASWDEPWSLWATEELYLIAADDGTPALQARARPGSFLPEVTIYPLARGDVRPLQRVFDGLSPGTRQLRFLAATPHLRPHVAALLADVDHETHGCWVAAIGGEPVGIGRYIRTAADPTVAEIALEVVDACQGQGVGRLLLGVVGTAAADAGITSLLWLMDEDNRRARRLAAPLGGRFTLESGVLEGMTALPSVAPLDAVQIVRCARAARRRAAERAAA
jgi:GNAT superfamily N-acetyltransferase